MREVRQLQNELEEPTSAPSVTPSSDTTPLAWDPQALPQHDDLVSDSQPNHMMATPVISPSFGKYPDYRVISPGFGKYPEPQATGDHARPV